MAQLKLLYCTLLAYSAPTALIIFMWTIAVIIDSVLGGPSASQAMATLDLDHPFGNIFYALSLATALAYASQVEGF